MRALCRAYNPAMRAHLFLPIVLLSWTAVLAQQPAASPAPAAAQALGATAPPPVASRERAVQRIHLDDGLNQIDELRYGGETQNLTVTPRSGARPYQIVPSDGARNFPGALGSAAGARGQRVWDVLDF
jgi:hypothetical protein